MLQPVRPEIKIKKKKNIFRGTWRVIFEYEHFRNMLRNFTIFFINSNIFSYILGNNIWLKFLIKDENR